MGRFLGSFDPGKGDLNLKHVTPSIRWILSFHHHSSFHSEYIWGNKDPKTLILFPFRQVKVVVGEDHLVGGLIRESDTWINYYLAKNSSYSQSTIYCQETTAWKNWLMIFRELQDFIEWSGLSNHLFHCPDGETEVPNEVVICPSSHSNSVVGLVLKTRIPNSYTSVVSTRKWWVCNHEFLCTITPLYEKSLKVMHRKYFLTLLRLHHRNSLL